MMRPVPRNIDKPNRSIEYVVTFLIAHYAIMFTIQHVLLAWGVGLMSVYIVYRLTQNKPEGTAFRVFYRFVNIGGFVPNPKKTKKFEI
jgi:hypothetical protein